MFSSKFKAAQTKANKIGSSLMFTGLTPDSVTPTHEYTVSEIEKELLDLKHEQPALQTHIHSHPETQSTTSPPVQTEAHEEIVLPENDPKDFTAIRVALLVICNVEKFLLREKEVDVSSEAMADILEDRFSKVMSLYQDTMPSNEDLEKMTSNAAIVVAKCAKKLGWLIDISNQETEASLSTGGRVTSTKLSIMGIEVSTTLKVVSSDGKVVLHTNSKEYACELIATMQAVFGECHKD